ncbi:DUF1614 domain-containing protein [Thermoproteus tenax]|uniref:DUF1614 domain-containing protein n=1 Tax=Thermoproteus tenax (strain ATCC 35583 / DSM 2078 / JCM 9277 / NBRC 100435 / Kra 1) TaxID=768679 RepID=G4RP34_THETK|nr:DUF1614 domain-containing protein [Thermoproteus tenax]CCC81329.1 conserved hypothetical protein [Thermoproteus tenax Kra 1]
MDRVVFSPPFTGLVGILYALLALLLLPSYLAGLAEVLRNVGLNIAAAIIVAAASVLLSLLLSPFHLVVYTSRRRVYYPSVDIIYVFGLPIPVPKMAYTEQVARLAVNLGGAVIPVALSTFILFKLPTLFAAGALVSSLAVSLIVYRMSRVVPGLGVVTPGFLPPLLALVFSLWAGRLTPAVAYIVGVYGTLLGADVYNLKKILAQMPPLASIGGAGVWDGIYLTGIVAATLGLLLR